MLENLPIAFLIGGFICLIGQLIMDLTPFIITSAHVLISYVTTGAILSALGLYEKLVELAGAGATVPLSGFGHLLAQGAIRGVKEDGIIGAFSGGIGATAGGIVIALLLGFSMAIIFDPKG